MIRAGEYEHTTLSTPSDGIKGKENDTFAPQTAIFLPVLTSPFLTPLANASSTSARNLYHPSVTSNTGCAGTSTSSLTCSSVHNISDMQRIKGTDAGQSWAVMRRRAERRPEASSWVYLQASTAKENALVGSTREGNKNKPILYLPNNLLPAPSLLHTLRLQTHHPN